MYTCITSLMLQACVLYCQMLLEVNSHMSELRASGNARQDVLELIPMQLLIGGRAQLLLHHCKTCPH